MKYCGNCLRFVEQSFVHFSTLHISFVWKKALELQIFSANISLLNIKKIKYRKNVKDKNHKTKDSKLFPQVKSEQNCAI